VKRITIVFEFDTLNGGERSMLAVIDELRGIRPNGDGDQCEFVILAPETGQLADAVRGRGVEMIPLRIREKTRLPDADERLLSAIQQADPDLVHANSLSMSVLLGSVAGQINVPCLSHLRDIVGLSNSAITKLNQNDSLIAVSQATKSFHIGQGLSEDKTAVVYNGVDCKKFRPRLLTGQLKRELDLPDDAFLIATIGQIGMRKGLDTLAEAAAVIGDQYASIHFLLIGERYSQKDEAVEYESSIRKRFEEAGLSARLHRLGYRNDVANVLNEIDLLVHPAKQEPLGRVLLEAGASGVPIIATKVGGTEEIFPDDCSARLIPPQSHSELADAIVELYNDANQRDSLAKNARRRIESEFSIELAAARLRDEWTRHL